ncbi:hypothetical protein IQ235_14460 [Oscillatoriales cyanobacterium LEGE 11467]|uniref:Uncharacterized protein n=1 Tax=Zarconia navalis LEGE 11467 TaxID=1828826 RepID=A0A928VXF1_9CYAN|nr:hypothetical protein [Zarconia navalis]MBE9041982.1 hypothetical protein [Zarconia navalis LEGE 11467]
MELGSQPGQAAEEYPHPGARLIGTVIALVTLTLPFWTIARYSFEETSRVQHTTTPTYPLQQVRK